MPNWCSNSLTIKGDASTLVQLKEIIESDGEGLLEAIKPLGKWDNGLAAIEAWGTKWDVSSEGLEYTDNGDGTAEITGWFDSAWSPPIDAFNTLAKDWDSCYIELMYEEPGMGFVGCWDSEGVGGANNYRITKSKPDKDFIYQITLNGKPLEDDKYQSLEDAMKVMKNMKRVGNPSSSDKFKILKLKRPKMTGPTGKLPK